MLTHLIQRRKAGGLDRLTNNPPNINMMTIVDASIRRARTTSDAIELYRNAKLAVEREVSSISNTKKPKCAAEQVSPIIQYETKEKNRTGIILRGSMSHSTRARK
jgi:hypothetical protein